MCLIERTRWHKRILSWQWDCLNFFLEIIKFLFFASSVLTIDHRVEILVEMRWNAMIYVGCTYSYIKLYLEIGWKNCSLGKLATLSRTYEREMTRWEKPKTALGHYAAISAEPHYLANEFNICVHLAVPIPTFFAKISSNELSVYCSVLIFVFVF